MVPVRIQAKKQEIIILTKAARRVGFQSPSQFVMALIDGNHTHRSLRKAGSMPKPGRVTPGRWEQ